jgi:hypothetical protein
MSVGEFLKEFYPDESEVIHGRLIRAKNTDVFPAAKKVPFSIRELRTNRDLQTELKKWNQTHGVYFTVNAGGDSDEEINRINAIFCEIDDRPLVEQHDLYDMSPMPPSIRLETRNSVHAYWLLDEYLTPNEFTVLQKGLIKFFKADDKLCNPSRVMRVPFFNHVAKIGGQYEYKPITIHSYNSNRFNYSDLFNAYPWSSPPVKKFEKRVFANSEHDEQNAELIRRIQSTSMYHSNGQYGYTRGRCHDGKGNNGIFVHLASGAVKCFFGCKWKEIAESFGVLVQ